MHSTLLLHLQDASWIIIWSRVLLFIQAQKNYHLFFFIYLPYFLIYLISQTCTNLQLDLSGFGLYEKTIKIFRMMFVFALRPFWTLWTTVLKWFNIFVYKNRPFHHICRMIPGSFNSKGARALFICSKTYFTWFSIKFWIGSSMNTMKILIILLFILVITDTVCIKNYCIIKCYNLHFKQYRK